MSQLSELDFQRLQETLLELKSRNYTLEDQSKKQRSALGDAQAKVTVLQQELTKAQKTIEKSKKLAEVQKILNENDNLQRKLFAQEEDFRLQNQTLLNELSLLVTANEKLEKENTSQEPSNVTADRISSLEKELENQVVKNVELEKELSLIRKQQIDRITDEFSMDLEETDISFKSLKNKDSDFENLKIELEGERTEKVLKEKHNEELKCQLSKKSEQVKTLEDDLSKKSEEVTVLKENLKRKQEEKDKLVNEQEEESRSLKKNIQILENQLELANKNLSETKSSCISEVKSLEEQVINLQKYAEKYSEEKFKEFESQIVSLQNKLEASVIDREKNLISFEQQKIQFEKLQLEFSVKCSDIDKLEKVNDELNNEISSLKSLSDKRKNLIDEMAIEIQQKIDEQKQTAIEHEGALNKLSEEKAGEINELDLHVQSLNDRIKDLEPWQEKFQAMSEKYEAENCAKKDLESQIKDLQKDIKDNDKSHQKTLEDLTSNHEKQKEEFNLEVQKINKEFDIKLELVNVQKCEFEESVSKLKQEIKDNLEERKISEKKGHALAKDLKRQLQQERSKNEKLQEKMKECFETGSNASEPSISRDNDGDRTSVSSWSLMSGQNDRASTPNQFSPSPFHSSNGLMNEQYNEDTAPAQNLGLVQLENEALVSRVAKLQEEKWQMEERLTMLEQSGAEMAQEIVSKTKIIQQYCMDSGSKRYNNHASRSNPSTPSSDKVRNFVDKLDKLVNLDSNQKEVHKQEVSSMQKMLEETLLKNMHLQQDLESMSQEVVRLSKLSPSKA